MINLHSDLLEILDGNELAVFCHILKRIDKKNKSFPSRFLLQEETSFGREKISKAINGLVNKNILTKIQQKNNGKFSKTVYIITTDLAGIYISAKNESFDIEDNRDTINRDTENRSTEKPLTEKQPLSINQYISINKFKETPPNSFKKLPPRDFYKKELEENKKHKFINYYDFLVKILFGENELEEPLQNILKLPRQVKFKEFLKLYELSKKKKKKFSQILPALENNSKYTKNRKSLYLILLNWLNNEF